MMVQLLLALGILRLGVWGQGLTVREPGVNVGLNPVSIPGLPSFLGGSGGSYGGDVPVGTVPGVWLPLNNPRLLGFSNAFQLPLNNPRLIPIQFSPYAVPLNDLNQAGRVNSPFTQGYRERLRQIETVRRNRFRYYDDFRGHYRRR